MLSVDKSSVVVTEGRKVPLPHSGHLLFFKTGLYNLIFPTSASSIPLLPLRDLLRSEVTWFLLLDFFRMASLTQFSGQIICIAHLL